MHLRTHSGVRTGAGAPKPRGDQVPLPGLCFYPAQCLQEYCWVPESTSLPRNFPQKSWRGEAGAGRVARWYESLRLQTRRRALVSWEA